ncbi:MAG TPA: AmmeMemoRadiSam system radical SAM enzyme [Anaerolineaceae bacterium]
MSNLAEKLDRMTRPAETLVEQVPAGDGAVRCLACGHRCLIKPGRRGICQVRYNDNGVLRAPWGYVAALNSDPIEKKPFFHVLPGQDVLTFGMLGCDFHCGFCQNWVTSQAMRDPACEESGSYVRKTSPEQLVAYALQSGARLVASSYNEPLITSEWAVSVFEQANQAGLKCVFVSNGNATPEALDYLAPHLVAYKVDLKTMQDKQYRKLGGVLQHVLDTIRMAHERGLWVEVVTLLIPGFNDSVEELWDGARYIASVSPDIPWHITAFHPDYKMTDPPPTSVRGLQQAAEIGQEAGLHFVYAGNLSGQVGDLESTLCPQCGTRLIQRVGFTVLDYQITAQGSCPKCGANVPGVWTDQPETVPLGSTSWLRRLAR